MNSTHREYDFDTDEVVEERNASWIIDSGVLAETDLIERNVHQPYAECFE